MPKHNNKDNKQLLEEGQKKCPNCGETKPLKDFYKNRSTKDGYSRLCKLCKEIWNRKYYTNNKERCNAAKRLWEANNREKCNAARKLWRKNNRKKYLEKAREYAKKRRAAHKEEVDAANKKWRRKNKVKVRNHGLKYNYGISDMGHLFLYSNQNGCCAICKNPIPYSEIKTDHDHETGEVRGLLCHSCNTFLGWLENRLSILDACLEYLDGKRE